MSRYDELRPHYGRSPDERMALLEHELRGPLDEAAAIAAEIRAASGPRPDGRFGELIELLEIASAKLAEVATQLPVIRARAAGGLAEEDVHLFRHDLLTPIGTVRGAAIMLARVDPRDIPGAPADFTARAERLAAVLNEIKDILDALTDSRGRQP